MTSRSLATRAFSFVIATRVRALSFAALGAVLVAWPLVGRAQNPSYPAPPQSQAPSQTEWNTDDVPAHIAIVDGTATLERDSASSAAEMNVALLTGDRLRTSQGRVEVMFADGSTIDLDNGTTLDFLSDSLLRLQAGRVRLSIPRVSSDLEYRVDAAGATATFKTGGEYRVTVSDVQSSEPQVDLAVLFGSAELSTDQGRTLVRAGSHALATEHSEPSVPYQFNASSSDEFDQWIESQRPAHYGSTSSQYLPSDLRYYSGDFDQYGTWDYQQSYGYVWYPQVDLSWRPYSTGQWSFVGDYGWFWVGNNRWSWPTHHYGRWGFTNSRWFWIPDRRWSPAWVSWASTNDYVSWCPLGFDNRPVIGLGSYSRGYDPWSSWTVVPFRSFSPGVFVSRVSLPGRSFGADTWSRFTVRSAAPVSRVSVSRNVQPLRSPTVGHVASRGGVTTNSGSNWVNDRGVTRSQPESRTTSTSSRGFNTTNSDPRTVQRGYATPRTSPTVNDGRNVVTPNNRGNVTSTAPPTWTSRSNPSAQPSTNPQLRQADPRTYATPRTPSGSWQTLPQNLTPSRGGRGNDQTNNSSNSSFTTRGYWQSIPGTASTPQGGVYAQPRGATGSQGGSFNRSPGVQSPNSQMPVTGSRPQSSPWQGRSPNSVGGSQPSTPQYAVPRGGTYQQPGNDRGGAQSRGGGSSSTNGGGRSTESRGNSGGNSGRSNNSSTNNNHGRGGGR
jgi:hypothetical protein